MSKSTQVAKVDEVQAALHVALKPKGFRKKARTFNRVTDDGLMQVINLQMGAHDPPGTVHIPGLRENLYGRFTVNLGVYVPEVAHLHGGGEARGFVQDHQCCVRERLGGLSGEKMDLWWLNDATAQAIPDVLARVERDALPFLERFGSRDAILRELEDPSQTVAAAPRIVSAIILVERGAAAAAKVLLAQQALETPNPGHAAYVRSLAARLGIPLEDC